MSLQMTVREEMYSDTITADGLSSGSGSEYRSCWKYSDYSSGTSGPNTTTISDDITARPLTHSQVHTADTVLPSSHLQSSIRSAGGLQGPSVCPVSVRLLVRRIRTAAAAGRAAASSPHRVTQTIQEVTGSGLQSKN